MVKNYTTLAEADLPGAPSAGDAAADPRTTSKACDALLAKMIDSALSLLRPVDSRATFREQSSMTVPNGEGWRSDRKQDRLFAVRPNLMSSKRLRRPEMFAWQDPRIWFRFFGGFFAFHPGGVLQKEYLDEQTD